MHEKSLHTIEYPKILAKVAGEAAFSASKELVLALEPTPDIEEARHRLACTSEAMRLLDQHPDTGVRGAHDIRPLLVRAAREGVLSPRDLVEVLDTLRSTLVVTRALEKLDPEQFPLLRALGAAIPQRPHLVRRIEETISEEGEILDTASPTLRKLRFDIRGANQRLQDRLRTLVNEFGPALQEQIVTMRNERYVIPVKAELRNQVRGIVHDQSGSGATVFVEPLVIVELNNKLRELQIEERQEIERILRVLSSEIGREAEALKAAVELLAEFDFHLAKARYARLTRSSAPRLNEQGRIVLHNARHPLLTGKVVPISFHMGQDFFMVVITGPNTGGKTVALKTVGLLTLMAQAGLFIPADDDSEIAVFEDVFADIGDEQSIEQSLSTFSSHLSRIIDILRRIAEIQRQRTPDIHGVRSAELLDRAGKEARFLVLLDELGAGTDPSEGSALARAILAYLLKWRISTVATTHYSELKAFAYEQLGAVNASVEFDIETLSPTYKLSIGLPGRSNALAIASRLGLDESIIERAREFLGSAGVRMESLLEGLQSERKAVADERFHLSMERAEAEYQRKQLEEERYRLEEERVRILNEARAQARRELESVQAQLAKIKIQASRSGLTHEQLSAMRQRARQLDEKITTVPEPRRPAQQAAEVERLEGPLQIGDTVRVLNFNQTAELVGLSADRSEAEVQMGALRLRVNADNIERISKRKAAADGRERTVTIPRLEERAPVAMQLDIRGWRVEDALEELDAYLNNAALAGLATVRIVHGKGTGALRSAIREQLSHHPLAKSFAPAPPREGGDGVTVVTLSA
ncbi:MAG: endonuclease MutS2 [Ktedonobacteraceae bacterium]|nr:endonuclease MutS2 [Ktedonobacteraceae bacterium]